MDSQQQSIYNYSQQMESMEQPPNSSQQTTITTGVVFTPIYKEPHMHLATPFDKLEVLHESLVDFENMKRNVIYLTEELRKQGWENYFQRLYGPVYNYLDLASQGVDISEFSVDWLPEHPPNFMKRQREPFDKSKKAKKANLGEPYISRPLVPLIESPSKSLPPPSRSVNLKQIAFSLPQTTPIYTHSEPSPSTTKPSDTPTSNPSSPPFQKFNLSTTTLPISEFEMLNEPISPISSTPSSPPYYILSSDSKPSDPQSPTLAQLQARALASQQQPEPKAKTPPPPEQPIPPPFEQPQIPTLEEPITPPSEQPPTPPP
ncbi:proline-rich extensin-like protein EPR1 [Lathyrus oleraceus]|uniref:proline-rich extensin-like protein EPR1 n=1 Tax=Pisum sativum TaxID=3888 RepID=UPI0021D0334B|nr:proline-rich extensin-like protein EPR1 [Pisum sativum]